MNHGGTVAAVMKVTTLQARPRPTAQDSPVGDTSSTIVPDSVASLAASTSNRARWAESVTGTGWWSSPHANVHSSATTRILTDNHGSSWRTSSQKRRPYTQRDVSSKVVVALALVVVTCAACADSGSTPASSQTASSRTTTTDGISPKSGLVEDCTPGVIPCWPPPDESGTWDSLECNEETEVHDGSDGVYGAIGTFNSGCASIVIELDGRCTLTSADPPVSAATCHELWARVDEERERRGQNPGP